MTSIQAKEHKRGQMVLRFYRAKAVATLPVEDLHTEVRKLVLRQRNLSSIQKKMTGYCQGFAAVPVFRWP